jgi:uncharacterized protein YaeQ
VIHRFAIALADVDRGIYRDLDLRVARHPSEDVQYLLTRVLAFALECGADSGADGGNGLEFSKGLGDGEQPALWQKDPQGRLLAWIEVGSPLPERLHRASKACDRVVVYCHRRPDLLVQRCAKERVHRAHAIRVVHVPTALLDALADRLDRNNRWDLSVHEGRATVVVGGDAFEGAFPGEPLGPLT